MFMKKINQFMTLFFLVIQPSCKKWDPNFQYSEEVAHAKSLNHKLGSPQIINPRIEMRIGDSLTKILDVIGSNYEILATINTGDSRWLKIEYFEENKFFKKNRKALLFKNGQLFEIYEI